MRAITRNVTEVAIERVVADEVVHESWFSLVTRLSVGEV